MTESFEFRLITRSFNAEKRSIEECLCSLLAPLVCVIFSCVKILNGINILIMINSVTCSLMRLFYSPSRNDVA